MGNLGYMVFWGIHVDDGIGGGDSYFGRVIEQLRGIYNFGSYDEGEFVFTGIRFRQWGRWKH